MGLPSMVAAAGAPSFGWLRTRRSGRLTWGTGRQPPPSSASHSTLLRPAPATPSPRSPGLGGAYELLLIPGRKFAGASGGRGNRSRQASQLPSRHRSACAPRPMPFFNKDTRGAAEPSFAPSGRPPRPIITPHSRAENGCPLPGM